MILERLDKLLHDFYLLTGLTVSVWDSNLNILDYTNISLNLPAIKEAVNNAVSNPFAITPSTITE